MYGEQGREVANVRHGAVGLMRSRSTNLRAKVVGALLSLVALWSFAAWVTLRDGVNLLGVQTIDSQIVGPSEPLLLELQIERRLSAAQLGGPSPDRENALVAARRNVDDTARRFRDTAQSRLADFAADAEAERTVNAAIAALDTLPGTRQSIDNRSVDQAAAGKAFSGLIDSLFDLYDVVGGLDDAAIEADTRNLIELYRIRELISQEDALLSGALAAGRSTTTDNAKFVELVAGQRFLTVRASGLLRESERATFDAVIAGPAFTNLRALEDRVLARERSASQLPLTSNEWDVAAEAALTELQNMVLDSGDALVDRATPVAVWVVVRLILAAGLGLLAVVAAIVVSVTTSRELVARLQRLRKAADQLADERLPGVVERISHGEKVDVEREAPPLDFGDDEIGQVGKAFTRLQRTTISTAAEQAELRQNVREVFLSLARRTQALVHRQHGLLYAMEKREHDADELEDLFRVDHLATRMRRIAENLILLSGGTPGRVWRRDILLFDVARAALQEVEDYQRVKVIPFGPIGVKGRVARDVTHLLAELIENALSFSPPHTEVEVRGQLVARGFAIEVEDRGLGMADDDFSAANDQIASTKAFSLDDVNKLGLYVVSHLARKHQLMVHLKRSGYGGTTAVVLIPLELITTADSVGTATTNASVSAAAGDITGTLGSPRQASPLTGGAVAVEEPPAPRALTAPTVGLPAVREASTHPPRSTDAEAGAALSPSDNADQPPPPFDTRTTGGLPVRVRQRSIAPQLRDGSTRTDVPARGDSTRSPDQIRTMMSSYQSGTRRGRLDAEGQYDQDNEGPGDMPASAPASTDG
ncbi:sensor histidine kinase [Micromonospora taraxaci]|nr:nitrate- and nitrite sensing domain-containing protein [Micromonospora taraxaci]